MRTRTSPDALHTQGVRTLKEALVAHGVKVTHNTVTVPDGDPQPIEVIAASRVTAPVRPTLTAPSGTPRVVVADVIDYAARDALDAAGVSWLDRRGHIHLTLPGLIIDTPTEATTRGDRRRDLAEQPIRGHAGLTVAVDTLHNATNGAHPAYPSELSRRTGIPVSSLSLAFRQLRSTGLVTDDGPVNPDLFWATAQQWRPIWVNLDRIPTGNVAASLLAGNTLAAVHYGIPLAVTESYPWELYAPSERVAGRIAARYQGPGETVARIAVAPTPAVFTDPRPGDPFQWVPPIVVALDLAADPARGAEAINDWDPEGIHRVW